MEQPSRGEPVAVDVQLVDVMPLLAVIIMQCAVWSWTVVVEEHSLLDEVLLSSGVFPHSSSVSGLQNSVSPLMPVSSSLSLVH